MKAGISTAVCRHSAECLYPMSEGLYVSLALLWQFQISADAQPDRKQVMAQKVGSLLLQWLLPASQGRPAAVEIQEVRGQHCGAAG